jgi:hypothetical protein
MAEHYECDIERDIECALIKCNKWVKLNAQEESLFFIATALISW